jgi:pSer/pThr/pTyr-binding forkhead associated (FHA) protein
MNDLLGWSVLLFVGKWVFVGLIYLFLFVAIFAVRRELSGRLRGGRRVYGFTPGRLRVLQNGTDRSVKAGQLLDLPVEARLGAEPDNDVVLRDQFVSGRHARMRWDGAGWWIEDLGSTNGTRVDAAPCIPGQPVRVASHARIMLGDMSFELLENA